MADDKSEERRTRARDVQPSPPPRPQPSPPSAAMPPPAAAPAPPASLPLDEVDASYLGSALSLGDSSASGVNEIPPELGAFVSELEQWAALNARDARRDTVRFWSLKVPALLSSASAGVLAIGELGTIAAILAAVASTCVLIDAVNPGGQLRNAHLRAVHDLRLLQHQIMNNWRIGTLRGKSESRLAAEILQSAEKARDKVAADLRIAETSFAPTVDAK